MTQRLAAPTLPPLAPSQSLTCAYAMLGIGASLGGLAALAAVLAPLPEDFPIPILVVQHTTPDGPNLLPAILARYARLRVVPAESGERTRPGSVYVARPDHHLLVAPDGTLALARSERVNFTRPAADVLFRSLAEVFAERAIGLVLTGMGRDGARGLAAIWAAGGLTMAQDEATAIAPSMPGAAIDIGRADVILPLHRLPAALCAATGSALATAPGAGSGAADAGASTEAAAQARWPFQHDARAEPLSRETQNSMRPDRGVLGELLGPADLMPSVRAVERARRLLAEIERTVGVTNSSRLSARLRHES